MSAGSSPEPEVDRVGTAAWVPASEAVAERIGDGLLLVHLTTDEMYEMNHTGARLWALCEQGLDRRGIQETLLREFDVDEAALTRELDTMLRALVAARLLVPRDSS